jgi:hypothetical protein
VVVLAQHPHVRLLQLRPGRDAELLPEPGAQVGVDAQGGGLLAGGGQGQHQARVQPLVQRLVPGEHPQPRHDLAQPPQPSGHIGQCQGGGDPALAQRDRGRVLAHARGHVGEYRAAPVLQRGDVVRPGELELVRVAGPGGPTQPFGETAGIDLIRRHLEPVATPGQHDRVGLTATGALRLQQRTQLSDVDMDERVAGARRLQPQRVSTISSRDTI